MNRASLKIAIRPQQPWFWLVSTGLLLAGAMTAGNLYHRGVWLFATLFLATVFGFVRDAIVFDGEKLKRRGPGAWLYGLLIGCSHEMTLDELETISSYVEGRSRRNGVIIYRTIISGTGKRWEFRSDQRKYHAFIKALFPAVSPNKLDPRSQHLLAYWQENKQAESSRINAARRTPPAQWRNLANQLALSGQFDAAARYFRLAYRREPDNAHLLYEMGRFLQLRAMLESHPGEFRRRTPQGKSLQTSCASRADACLRLAGRLASHDATLLARIGESYFEIHRDDLAEQFFTRALRHNEQSLRASIGRAEVAFRTGRLAHVIHFYRATARLVENPVDESLARLAGQRADYYERLQSDDRFLAAEMSRLSLLNQLRWARRGAMLIFLGFWLIHLAFQQSDTSLQALSREISATAAVVWLSTIAASYLFAQRRS